MRILALDASTTTVGWCKAQDGDYLASGVYVATAQQVLGRIWQIENWLCRSWLPSGFSFEPEDALKVELVILERPTGNHGNMGTSVKLGGVFYALLSHFGEREIEVLEVTASQVRASGCHKGTALIAAMYKGGALDEKHPGDEADAIGVWLAGLKLIKEREMREGGDGP